MRGNGEGERVGIGEVKERDGGVDMRRKEKQHRELS